jgi:hypothetical protein
MYGKLVAFGFRGLPHLVVPDLNTLPNKNQALEGVPVRLCIAGSRQVDRDYSKLNSRSGMKESQPIRAMIRRSRELFQTQLA